MSTINMKKVGDTYEPEMDPYSEYQHEQPAKPEEKKVAKAEVHTRKVSQAREAMNAMFDNIDEAIDGAELVMEFGDKFMERLRRF